MRVLVADDDPTTRTLLRRLLIHDFDCAVTEVDNGLEALAEIDKSRYAVLLLDVNMPVMGGLEVIRGSAHGSLPVVMLTAERGEAVVKQAVALGIADYLVKPLKPNRTGERLARVLHSLGSDPAGEADANARRMTLDEHLAVLVAEGDPDYRHILMDFFNTRCAALQAASGAEALTLFLRVAPRLVFVGGELGIVDADTLVRKMRVLSALTNTRIIATVPRSRTAEVQACGVYDGVITRSFVPDIFRDQFERLMVSTGPPPHALEKIHPRFRTGLIVAVEMVFGMALAAQVELVQESVNAAGETLAATMQLTARERQMRVDVTLQLQLGAADALTRRMGGFDKGETLSDADQTATLGELLNMIVGRVQNTLAERGVPAEAGLPKTGRRQAPVATDETGAVLTFETDDGLRFDVIAVAHALVNTDVVEQSVVPDAPDPVTLADTAPARPEPDGARGDVAAVVDRFGGDAGMAQQLAEVFLEDYPGRLEEVQAAVARGEADALRRAAHTLKGSVGTLSEDGAYEAARRLEKMGRDGDLGDARAALDALERELGRFRPVLERLADSTAAA